MNAPFYWRRRRSPASAETIRFPLPFNGRIASLQPDFDFEQLIDSAPEALIVPLDLALSLADRKQRGLFALPSLSVALVVLTSLDDSPLAAHHRDLLWRAFGVPIFEQLRNDEGVVIARECEVHNGLHVANSAAIPRGFEVIGECCECGDESPRLRCVETQSIVTPAT